MGEDRARLKVEGLVAARVLDDQSRTGDVGGHEVRRKLNPAEVQLERLAQGADQERLPQSGGALQEDVTAGEDRRQDAANDLRLPDDRHAQRRLDLLGPGAKLLGSKNCLGNPHGLPSPRRYFGASASK